MKKHGIGTADKLNSCKNTPNLLPIHYYIKPHRGFRPLLTPKSHKQSYDELYFLWKLNELFCSTVNSQ